MPPEKFGTISAAAVLASVGVMTTTSACFSAGDDILTTSDISGADYGGPEAGDFDTDGVFETDEAEASSESSSSTTESTTETTESESTAESTSETTETTGGPALCGWLPENAYYECGYEGVDPGGTPIECPPGLVAGEPCANTGLTQVGCCDENADNWYCDGQGNVFFNDC